MRGEKGWEAERPRPPVDRPQRPVPPPPADARRRAAPPREVEKTRRMAPVQPSQPNQLPPRRGTPPPQTPPQAQPRRGAPRAPVPPPALPPVSRRPPPPVRPWEDGPQPSAPDATQFIPRIPAGQVGTRWPTADPDFLRPYDQLATQVMPRVTAGPLVHIPGTTGEQPVTAPKPTSLGRASGRMAIASLISRITGFLWKLLLVYAIGQGMANDSFNVANTFPNIVFELLLGGVLASVVVPLLVRSQDDKDGGIAYAQRLMTVALTLLLVGTVLAVIAAPLFTSLYVDKSSANANPALATAFAYLLLPEIFFYGLFALVSAVLNAKNIFSPTAWAPVVNNLVVIVTILVVWVMPGEISLNPVKMSDPKLLTLGLGVTFGIVAQALMLIPPLLRSGFRFKWRWGIDKRMKEFGGLALWILGYVAVSQLGYIANTRVLTAGTAGGVTAYSNAWLLFQLPYGVIGVSLLTAIMPRMSRAAADGDTKKLVGDLSYASRISTVMLLPISAVMTIIGSSVGIALFTVGKGSLASADRLGGALAISAFALLPYALVMLQMRVFYAMKDARTPTLIMIAMTAVKIPLLFLTPKLLDADHIVLGAMMVNALTFVVGAVLGQVWLWVTLGNLRSKRVLGVILFTVVASALGVAAALGVGYLVPSSLGTTLQAWIKLILQGTVGLVVSFGVLMALKVEEIAPATARITRLIRR